MNRLALLACAGLALQATGCIIVSDDDEPTGRIEATWAMALDGNVVTCDTQYVDVETVEVVAVGPGGTYTANFDCDGNGGTMSGVEVGTYTVTLTALTGNDERGTVTFPGVLVIEDGTTQLTDQQTDWILAFESPFTNVLFNLDFDDAGGANCGSAPGSAAVERIEISVVNTNGNACETHTFTVQAASTQGTTYCPDNEPGTAGVGCVENNVPITLELPVGTYDVIFSGMADIGGASGDTECFVATSADVAVGSAEVDLGTLIIGPAMPLPAGC